MREKRRWHYAYKPSEYEVYCDKCGKGNTWWSEWEHKIWCYDCKIDTDGTGGIFDGPIPYEGTLLLIGPYAFHRYYFYSGLWCEPKTVNGKIIYRRCKPPKPDAQKRGE